MISGVPGHVLGRGGGGRGQQATQPRPQGTRGARDAVRVGAGQGRGRRRRRRRRRRGRPRGPASASRGARRAAILLQTQTERSGRRGSASAPSPTAAAAPRPAARRPPPPRVANARDRSLASPARRVSLLLPGVSFPGFTPYNQDRPEVDSSKESCLCPSLEGWEELWSFGVDGNCRGAPVQPSPQPLREALVQLPTILPARPLLGSARDAPPPENPLCCSLEGHITATAASVSLVTLTFLLLYGSSPDTIVVRSPSSGLGTLVHSTVGPCSRVPALRPLLPQARLPGLLSSALLFG